MFALIQLAQMEWDKRKVNRLVADAKNATAATADIRMVKIN